MQVVMPAEEVPEGRDVQTGRADRARPLRPGAFVPRLLGETAGAYRVEYPVMGGAAGLAGTFPYGLVDRARQVEQGLTCHRPDGGLAGVGWVHRSSSSEAGSRSRSAWMVTFARWKRAASSRPDKWM